MGLSDAGAAGLMGNLYAESGLNPNNLQNSHERKLGYTDESYTEAVDRSTYTCFSRDGAGYGLCQWTYWSRKAALLEYARVCKSSIGDLEMQLDFLMHELSTGYKAVLSALKTASSVRAASDCVMLQFERPADQSEAAKAKRAGYGQAYYDKYAKKGSDTMGFTNSPLATVKMISPNKTVNRNHAIDTITIHCFVGQVTAKRGCEVFLPASKKASCNYVVGYDGSIGLCVEEKDRSWCTGGTMKVNGISGSANDYQAVTIEVACDAKHPYAITEKAMTALIELCADICRRNGIKQLLWSGDKNLVGQPAKQNMTVHRWFAAKACPGDYIYQRLGDIAAAVNAKLEAASTVQASKVPYTVRVTATDLPIRKGPGMTYGSTQCIKPGVYTVTEENNGFGRLKSGAGWISLAGVKKA